MTNFCSLGSETHVWIFSTRGFGQCEVTEVYDSVLNLHEKKRADRLSGEDSKKQFIVSRYFLKSVLSSYVGCFPREVSIAPGRNNKPILLKQYETQPIFFNLSHSEEKCALVIGKQEALGIDIENSEKERRFNSLSKRYFSSSEHESIVKLAPREKRERFYRLWTLKEAYAKASGNSLAISLGKTSFSLDEENIKFEREGEHRLLSRKCCFLALHGVTGFKVSLAVVTDDTKAVSDLGFKSFEFSPHDQYEAMTFKFTRIVN